MLKRKLIALSLSAFMVFGLVGCGNSTSWTSGKDAIKVNDEVLTSGYLDSRIKQVFAANEVAEDSAMADSYRAGIVKSAVDLSLLLQEANKRNIQATDEDINKLKDELVKASGSEENFSKDMDTKGISKKDINSLLKQQVIFNKLQDDLKKEIKIDTKGYYESNQDDFKVGEQVKARHILVKTEEEAKKVIEELKKGKDFNTLAKEYSTDESNKNNGGDLGYFEKDKMVKPFSDAAFSMQVGTYSSKPVKTDFGFHIIMVDDKKPARIQSFDEIKADLEKYLLTSELELKVSELTDKLNKSAKVEYLLDEYNPKLLEEKAQKAMEEAQKKNSAEKHETDTDKENSK